MDRFANMPQLSPLIRGVAPSSPSSVGAGVAMVAVSFA
jgi:hypothetical protein